LVDGQRRAYLFHGVQEHPSDAADRQRLGAVLRACRTEAELTQEQLALKAHITKNYVADVEAGTRNPTYLVLARLVRALGLTWAAFGTRIDAERAFRRDPGRG